LTGWAIETELEMLQQGPSAACSLKHDEWERRSGDVPDVPIFWRRLDDVLLDLRYATFSLTPQ
jgi:hypothetical protein